MLFIVPLIAVMFIINMSPGEIRRLVKSVNTADCTAVPVDKLSPLVLITPAMVGIAVPDADRQNFTVTVPESPEPRDIPYLTPVGLPIVQRNGTISVALWEDVVSEDPLPGDPIANTNARGIDPGGGFCELT